MLHIFRPEYEAALHPHGLMGPFYIQQHWAHRPKWEIHDLDDEKWFDFDAIPIFDDVWLVPLPGHTAGHCGVAMKSGDGWLFHCGDAASPFHAPADPNRPADKPLSGIVRALIGPHAPRLRQFAQAHRDDIPS